MYRIVFTVYILLVISFLVNSIYIYTSKMDPSGVVYSPQSDRGRMVWQKNQCQTCHQLFGLGGYLGPDLTHLMEDTLRGRMVLRSVVNNAPKQMPQYRLSEEEISSISFFLQTISMSGNGRPSKFKRSPSGMIYSYP